MKTEIRFYQKSSANTEDPLKYPVLMKSKVSGTIVLFTGVKEGVCLKPDCRDEEYGEYTNQWAPATSDTWEALSPEAEVILKND